MKTDQYEPEIHEEIGVIRQCGRRVADVPYICCGRSIFGRPIEYFITCPPKIVPFAFNNRGVKLFQKPDQDTGEIITHILDHTGKNNYQVADMIEEVRAYGLSRKSYEGFNFSQLTYGKSKIWLSHAEAWIDNMPHEFEQWTCPKQHVHHDVDIMRQEHADSCCGGAWWQNLYAAEALSNKDIASLKDRDVISAEFPRPAKRVLSGGRTYYGSLPPEDFDPRYREAIFLVLPITNISIPHGRKSSAIAEKIRAKTDIPVWEPEA